MSRDQNTCCLNNAAAFLTAFSASLTVLMSAAPALGESAVRDTPLDSILEQSLSFDTNSLQLMKLCKFSRVIPLPCVFVLLVVVNEPEQQCAGGQSVLHTGPIVGCICKLLLLYLHSDIVE